MDKRSEKEKYNTKIHFPKCAIECDNSTGFTVHIRLHITNS